MSESLEDTHESTSSEIASAEQAPPEPSPPEGAADREVHGVQDTESPWGPVVERLLDAVESHVLGQRAVAEQLTAAYVAGGHALLEGVPGVGKTLLARSFAAALGLQFQRIQFTPDLMPADVLGTHIYDREGSAFKWMPGPVFTQILMADEINRTPPKTQAALLEGMQERQVSMDGERRLLDPSFFVVATQNPVEFEGTYPLPEAQLDRFLLRIDMGLPDAEHEQELYRRALDPAPERRPGGLPDAVLSPQEAAGLRLASRRVRVSEDLVAYLYRLADTVRRSPQLELGISPRGALALLEVARAFAVVEGRNFVIPDDFKRGLLPCWGHRLMLGAEAELEGHSAERLLTTLADSVDVPK